MDLFSSIGIQEIVMILVIALIFVGPGKIAEFGTTVGKMVNNLKNMSSDMTAKLEKELLEEKKTQETNASSPENIPENKSPDQISQKPPSDHPKV